MSWLSTPAHAEIRLRTTRGWSHRRGTEPPHASLTASDRAELARLAQIIDFRTAGSEIFSQGDEADFVYLLADGIVRTSHLLRNGDCQILAFHWPGDLFGLAEGGHYISEARTITPSRVYRFPVDKLTRFLLKNPRIQDNLLVKATHDLRQAQRQLVVMGRFDIPHRLAAFLIDCSGHERYFDGNSNILSMTISRDEIADYLGTSAETVTRAFGRLEREGLLRRLSARSIELNLLKLRTYIDFD